MERKSGIIKKQRKQIVMLLTVCILITSVGFAQNKTSISGKIVDVNNLPVPFASVVLFADSESASSSEVGTMSNADGLFSLGPVQPGKFRIIVSSVGFKPASEIVEVMNNNVTDAGKIVLRDSTIFIDEAVVVGERIRGKSESDKTVFYVNKKIIDVAGTGTDVLKYIPGIQVDLKQNISLEGSTSILFYVNGIERSKSYVSQLSPAQIDKVEVINTPPSGYDSNITGVINIILKKDKNAGVGGHVHVELPTSGSEVFLFPAMSLMYGFKKLNLFTSYNGEINYENIDECVYRSSWNDDDITYISSVQSVRQRNLFNQFHYGLDYFLNDKNQLNYYGFYNPFSYEQNGDVVVNVSGLETDEWNAQRKEKDRNTGFFNSLYYKHAFDQRGGELAFDFSHFYLDASNTTSFISDEATEGSYFNKQNPKQNAFSAKTDFTLPFGNKFTLNSGVKARIQKMEDKNSAEFSYSERIFAAYAAFNYKQNEISVNGGLRMEDSKAEIKNGTEKNILSVLPYFTCGFKLNSKQNLKLAFNRTLNRPSVYQLNSFTSTDNPWSVTIGNPSLKPEFFTNVSLEHTVQLKSDFFSTKLFYKRVNDVMNNLTTVDASGVFKTQLQNLGAIRQIGAQFLATLKAGSLTLNPVIRIYNMKTFGNNVALEAGVKNRSQLVFEPALSSVLTLKNELAFSAIIQYSTPKINIQDNSYCGVLYFISVDKTFKNNIKVGALSSLPFTGNFVYRASEIKETDITSRYEGHLKLSAVPLWIRISYQFSAGAKRERIEREKEEIDQQLKNGF